MGETREIVKDALNDPEDDLARLDATGALSRAVGGRGESINAREAMVFLSAYVVPDDPGSCSCACPTCIKTARAAIFAVAGAVDEAIKGEIENPHLVAAGNYLVVDGVIKE